MNSPPTERDRSWLILAAILVLGTVAVATSSLFLAYADTSEPRIEELTAPEVSLEIQPTGATSE